jgi:glycerophosphoryl diester phosphodiesterase
VETDGLGGRGSKWLVAKPIAHRGLHDQGNAPENSIPAFERCVAAGTPIELDVRLTRDGQVVVFHDVGLNRLCNVDASVTALSYPELAGLSLLGTRERIPLLADVLATVAGTVPLLVELKGQGRTGALERRVAAVLDGYRGAYAVQSFSPWTVGWFRRNRPDMLRGQLTCAYDDRKDMLCNALTRPLFLSVHKNMLHGSFLARLRQSGLPVLVWTITDKREAAFCKELGFNYIFDPC